jgi:hypothetical protein
MYSLSGWSHSGDQAMGLLSGRKWTERVMQVAQELSYRLPIDDEYDQGTPGRYQASHAEMQLMAFFLYTYFAYNTGALRNLRRVHPPVTHPKATILSSTEVCIHCWDFRNHLYEKLGVEFVLKSGRVIG